MHEFQLLLDKVCVIVGASSLRGIGYATAELFVRHGAKIVALDIAMDDAVARGIADQIEAITGIVPGWLGIGSAIQSPAC